MKKKQTLAINTTVDKILPEEEEGTIFTAEELDVLDTVFTSEEDDENSVFSEPQQIEEVAKGLPLIVTGTEAVAGIFNSIQDVHEDLKYLTWLVYGRNGSGKTTFGASGGYGTLIAAVEDGTMSVRKVEGVKKVRINTWTDYEALYWVLKQGKASEEGIELQLEDGAYMVKWLVTDTITKLYDLCLTNVILGDKPLTLGKDLFRATQPQRGVANRQMANWLTAFKKLPLQQIWLCQERNNSEDGDVSSFQGFPGLPKEIRNFVSGEADIIGHMYIKQIDASKIQYRMLVGGNEDYVTKDRTTSLGYALVNPKMRKLYEHIFKKEE